MISFFLDYSDITKLMKSEILKQNLSYSKSSVA